MKRLIYLAFILNVVGTILLTSAISYSQGTSEIFGQLNVKGTPASLTVDSNVGIGTSSPDASAILDVSSTTQGVIIPRMTTAQRDLIASPITGLQIFNITTNQHEYFNGNAWAALAQGITSENFIFAFTTSTQQIASANIFQSVTFENEIAKNGWTHSTSVDPEDFTCNQTGIYQIDIFGAAQKTGGASTLFELIVTLDGVEVIGSAFGTDLDANNEIKSISTTIVFSATSGQVLNIEITAGTTNSEIMLPSGNATSHVSLKFGITRIQ